MSLDVLYRDGRKLLLRNTTLVLPVAPFRTRSAIIKNMKKMNMFPELSIILLESVLVHTHSLSHTHTLVAVPMDEKYKLFLYR